MWFTILIALAASCLAYVIADWLRFRRIPGVGTYYPVIGHIPALAQTKGHPHQLVRDASAAAGDPSVLLMKPGLLEAPRYLVSDRAHVEHVLIKNFDNYSSSRGMRGDMLRELLGDGLLNADGTKWRIQHDLVAREFSTDRFRGAMAEVFEHNAEKFVDTLKHEMKQSQSGVIDVHRWLLVLTFDAFCELTFGVDTGGLDGKPQPFASAFDTCQEVICDRAFKYGSVWPLMRALGIGPERTMKRAMKTVDKFVYSAIDTVIKEAQQKGHQHQHGAHDYCLLRNLLKAGARDDGTYDRKFLRDMLMCLIMAGRDTTAGAVAWLVLELSRRPDVVAKIRAELNAAAGPGQPLTFKNVADCHYLEAVLNEGQRLHSTVPFNSQAALGPDTLPCGLRVNRDDVVLISNYTMGVAKRVWGPDAKAFHPDHWLQPDGTCKKVDPCRFPVFHAGPRACLGMEMAMLEMKVILGTLVRSFDFELAVPFDSVQPAMAITLQPEALPGGGLPVRLTARA